MNYYNASGQMDLSDRIAIETGICIGESFKKIAKRLRRHPSTIAHEVKENRTFIKGNYPNGKDCRMARQCTVRNLCGCDEEACNTKCRLCRGVDCTKVCDRYVSVACHKFDSPPYVCNNCKDKKLCNKDKYIYSAKFADVAVTRRRSESRQGVRLSDEKKEELDELVTRLVKKGQPLTHIYAEHENEMPVCLRTLYNYIDEGALSIIMKRTFRQSITIDFKSIAFSSLSCCDAVFHICEYSHASPFSGNKKAPGNRFGESRELNDLFLFSVVFAALVLLLLPDGSSPDSP